MQPAGTQWDAPATWVSLLVGEIGRVYVYSAYDASGGSTLAILLPQALGLEPISGREYLRHQDGTRLDATELRDTARSLAARERWVAEGVAVAGAEEFMGQAGAIVCIETPLTLSLVGAPEPFERKPTMQFPTEAHELARTRYPGKLLFATRRRQRRALRRLRVPHSEQV